VSKRSHHFKPVLYTVQNLANGSWHFESLWWTFALFISVPLGNCKLFVIGKENYVGSIFPFFYTLRYRGVLQQCSGVYTGCGGQCASATRLWRAVCICYSKCVAMIWATSIEEQVVKATDWCSPGKAVLLTSPEQFEI